MANNTGELKKFAQTARRQLREQVAARLDQVLTLDSAYLRERESALKELRQQIALTSKKAVVDRVAYTWFNRFCALRFMDVNRYNRIAVVSSAEGFTQPEILQEAKKGYIDEDLPPFVDSQVVFDLLGGKSPSRDPQQEAYRLLLVAVCNSYNTVMPFMFERIADYTELLMPVDLLSENSILSYMREAMTPEACQDVEVIGWLYQYYISERKDEVFEALKKNQKIEAKDIPAATQLFTPHWIVRYLVENSLGRLWLLNRPSSKLAEKMEFYIKPVEEEKDYLKVSSPEDIKLCDPACGSGHMLTYAFDLLYAIYEEDGYANTDIPRLILEKNLYGIEIDERAGALAAFAVFMKARGKDKRFFSRPTQPNICVMENITFTDQELTEYIDAVGHDLFTEPLKETLKQFEQAGNFGSLISPILTDVTYMRQVLESKNLGGNLLLYGIHERVQKALKQAAYLSPRYHVVVANPPYMGGSGMNVELNEFVKGQFPRSKADLGPVFIERNFELAAIRGWIGMITMQSWMFLSSFEKLRATILDKHTIMNMAHLGARAFDSIGGEVVSTTAFVLRNKVHSNVNGDFLRLVDGGSETEKAQAIKDSIQNPNCGWFYRASAADFKKIPGSPIAYWVSDQIRSIFQDQISLDSVAEPKQGLITGDNNKFLRYWFEVDKNNIGFDFTSREDAKLSSYKWFPFHKGGNFRKWYGNLEYVVNWQNDGFEIRNFGIDTGRLYSRPQNLDFYFKEAINWSRISETYFGVRYSPPGYIFSDAGCSAFPHVNIYALLAFMCSNLCSYFLSIVNPTLTFQVGDIKSLPIISQKISEYENTYKKSIQIAIDISKQDWDDIETSWSFTYSPLFFQSITNKLPIKYLYESYCSNWQDKINEIKNIEEFNNRYFLEAYGLMEEISYKVSLKEITLRNNNVFRYGQNKSIKELRSLKLTDTIREFISYAIGCMFGRYSLDKPGLILANQGDTLQDYLKQITEPIFTPDEHNAIPILDGDWFTDDASERFKKFLKITFGKEHYNENLAFIEQAIGRDIRSYFLKEFYGEHVKMYKKRPIYWMFSSPNGSFNVLIYMHRYNKDTVSVILNRYLREFRAKLEARKSYLEKVSASSSASQTEKVSALKEIEKLKKTLDEIWTYEKEILYPLATQQIEIDLDDGVKVNYAKFGKALAKIPGLEAKE